MNSKTSTKFETQLGKLYGRINYERQAHVAPKSFDLSKMQGLVQRLGSPEQKYPVIHVAGTKGKGSVCTMLGAILTASGLRTGVYTSPHMETIHQRMAVDGNLITDDQMLTVFERFEPIVTEYDQWLTSQNRRPVTFFEFTTAMAMQFFADQNCDAVVLETGLGGRLDSTNVCQPKLCIITNISLDHTKQLGTALEKIAFEKAGIIKPDVPVISGVTGEPCQPVIQSVAADRNSALLQRGENFSIQRHADGVSFDFTIKTGGRDILLKDLQPAMLGSHQADNAALAIAAAMELRQSGWTINDDAIGAGLSRSHLAGRMERICSRPTVLMDMSHNPASAEALRDYLCDVSTQWKTATKRTLIFATTKEKDCEKMLAVLLPIFDEIIFTQYQNNPRAMPTSDLIEQAQRLGFGQKVSIVDQPVSAWKQWWARVNDGDFVCIAGSVFLLAELRSLVIADCQGRAKSG
jgi:dihydrofolate synthase/folylpolyglutamate synthase